MSISLLIERQNPITRLNRRALGVSLLGVALRPPGAGGAGMRAQNGILVYAALRILSSETGSRDGASRQTEPRLVSLDRAHAFHTLSANFHRPQQYVEMSHCNDGIHPFSLDFQLYATYL